MRHPPYHSYSSRSQCAVRAAAHSLHKTEAALGIEAGRIGKSLEELDADVRDVPKLTLAVLSAVDPSLVEVVDR